VAPLSIISLGGDKVEGTLALLTFRLVDGDDALPCIIDNICCSLSSVNPFIMDYNCCITRVAVTFFIEN